MRIGIRQWSPENRSRPDPYLCLFQWVHYKTKKIRSRSEYASEAKRTATFSASPNEHSSKLLEPWIIRKWISGFSKRRGDFSFRGMRHFLFRTSTAWFALRRPERKFFYKVGQWRGWTTTTGSSFSFYQQTHIKDQNRVSTQKLEEENPTQQKTDSTKTLSLRNRLNKRL